MIQYIKTYLPQSFVIADNVATPEAVTFWRMLGQMPPRWVLALVTPALQR